MIAEETKRIERVSNGLHQMTEELETFVGGDFKQLSTKIDALVIDTDLSVKQADDLVVLIEQVAEGYESLVMV